MKVLNHIEEKELSSLMGSRSCNEPEPSSQHEEVINKPILRRLIAETNINSFVWQGHF